METKLVFMGSPDFAVPILLSLYENYKVIGVFTQPDRKSGRGKNKSSPPIKSVAEELNLKIFQPRRLRDPENLMVLQELNPDLIIVAAYGQILKKNLLDLPEYGCINVHASLLPRWRGAAPIQAAILNGDKETGVTIMKMDEGVDTGDIYSQQVIEIRDKENSKSLSSRMSEIGAELLIGTLPKILNGKLEPEAQDNDEATYAKLLKKADGLLDLNQEAVTLERQVRAYNPWPGTFMHWRHNKLIIHETSVVPAVNSIINKSVVINKKPAVGAAGGWLVLEEVQLPGKNVVSGKAFLNGVRDWEAD